MTYTVTLQANGDIASIFDSAGTPVSWNDLGFQAWNAARPTPYVLSANQTQLQQLKALSATQLGNATPAQLGFILKTLLQNVDTGVV